MCLSVRLSVFEICRGLEDDRAAVTLTSKVFNHLSFQHCLRAFAAHGASTPLIKILATFLSNRVMIVKVGQSWSPCPDKSSVVSPRGQFWESSYSMS